LKHLIISYGGKYKGFVTKQTNFIIVGSKPGKKFLNKAQELKVGFILYSTLAGMINGSVDPRCTAFKEVPEIAEHSQGYDPPAIQRDTNLPGMDEAAAEKVIFSSMHLRKCKEAATPEGTLERANLVAGSELIGQRGVLDTSELRKKAYRYASMVHATLWVLQGDVKDLIMELFFMGLDTLRAEDKMVCFLCPNNPSLHAKKRQDMPPKFQRIHAEWTDFDQSFSHFKNDIKEGHKRTYNVFFWLGSEKPSQMILDSYILEWDKTQPNGGIVKMTYKQVQSLQTAQDLILVGVPTNLDADALQLHLKGKMEDARQKMAAKKSYKYGSITKVPEFVLERVFIKHTPYAKWSEEDDIPFWAKMPLHLEYLLKDEDMLEHILAVMYRTKQFQGILGEAAFYHQNSGFDYTAGDCEIFAGVLMRHIVMVQSTSWVILKGLTKPDRPHIIQQLDDEDPEEVDVEVKRSVCEVMMEKKIQGTKVWVLIVQIPDGCRLATSTMESGTIFTVLTLLSGQEQYHPILGSIFYAKHQDFESKGVINLVQGSFNLQAIREAAEAIQDDNGRIKTRCQAALDQVLQRHDQTQLWVDLTLGMTKHQKEEHERQQALQATAKAKTKELDHSYNFKDAHSINPVEGRPDNGTTFTKTRNLSLGETAYDVVLQSDESDMEDILNNPYSNDEDNNGIKLEMNEVHCQTGKTRG
jgi:hypothetical protein